MTDHRRRVAPIHMLVAVVALGLAAAQSAHAEPDGAGDDKQSRTMTGDIDLAAKDIERNEAGEFVLDGSVTVVWSQGRIQADRMIIREQRHVEAEGHVLLIWQNNRIAGTRLTYDLEDDRGIIENAIGQMQAEYFFWARSAEKIGEQEIRLKSATVTTCTQPIAYWSFSVSSATITIDRYARMKNVRLKTGRVPVFYLPYLVWPVKQDRAVGLLLPEVHGTRNRGDVISQELFVPLGRNADVTLLGRYYTEAGFGGGGLMRWIPNRNGQAKLSGFYIRDAVSGNRSRYRAAYSQTQQFLNGFRMVADINLVSDFNYFSDFERELSLVSSPTILAQLEFARNGPWTSLNVRELRREQLFSGGGELVQRTLPEIEWRGRSRRLGKSPVYFGFQSSVAVITQEGLQQNLPISADYVRADVFPEFSVPISPFPWLNVTPRVTYRATYYTQRQRLVTNTVGAPTSREVLNEGLSRTLFGAGLEIVGPKLVRIYGAEGARARFKHSLEPNLAYRFLEDDERADEVLVFDDVDRFSGAGAEVQFGLRSRLFAKRPRSNPAPPRGLGESIVLPDGTEAPESPELTYAPPPSPAPQGGGEPVEIATFEVRQRRSFERDLSSADFDGDGVVDDTSPYSGVQLVGRYNPKRTVSLDVRSNYDILFDSIRDVTFSGMVHGPIARVRFSMVHREGLGVDFSGARNRDDTQLRLTTGFTMFRRKLQIDLDGSIDANPQPGQARIPDKRWRLIYHTQCCSFLVEKLNRDFSSLDSRSDLHFRVDLRGLGKIVETSF